jgi:hypothetical protein
LSRPFATNIPCGDATQLVIDQGHQLGDGFVVTRDGLL